MKKELLKKVIVIFMLSIILSGIQKSISRAIPAEPVETIELTPGKTFVNVKTPDQVRVVRQSNTSLQLKWGKVKDADGYIIYKFNKNKKKYTRYKTIKNANTYSFIDEIGTYKSAKYKICAYRKVDGEIFKSKKSYEVSARTYKQGDKKVNAGKVIINPVNDYGYYEPNELGYYEQLQLSVKVKPSKYSKSTDKKSLSTKIRWYSTNSKIATIDQNGVVTAKARTGKCYVYARAHNGKKSNRIKITVKNYAKPSRSSLQLWGAEESPELYGSVLVMFGDYYRTVTDIAEYFYLNRPKENEKFKCWLENGEVKMSPANYVDREMERTLRHFMNDFPYEMRLIVTSGRVDFTEMYGPIEGEKKAGMNVVFTYDKTKRNPNPYNEKFEITDNWVYGYFAGI